jgi:hypothetical protein
MVFVLPLEFYAPRCEELPVAQLDLGRGKPFLKSLKRRATNI